MANGNVLAFNTPSYDQDNKHYHLHQHNNSQSSSRVRWLVLALSFSGITCAYITRLNLSLAIVAMVEPSGSLTEQATKQQQFDNQTINDKSSSYDSAGPRFKWDSTSQAAILGSFFYTYGLLQIPGARFCERFGAKWPCFIITLCCGLISFMLPFVAPIGVWAVILLRALLGLVQSPVYPAYYAVLSKWFPHQEQSTALGTLTNGGLVGSIAAMLMTGFFCEHGWFGGWPAVFYTCGSCCLLWCFAWGMLSASYPRQHPWISETELQHIERNKSSVDDTSEDMHKTPWREIFSSKRVWVVIIAKFGIDWVFWLINLNLPLYLNHALHVRMHQNGLINSMLNVMLIISTSSGGLLADHVVTNQWSSRTCIRKSFQSVAVLGSSLCLLLVPVFQARSVNTVIGLFMLLMFFFGFNIGGDIPVVYDMTEQYPATIFAIANAVCSACGFLVPMFTDFVVGNEQHDMHRWTFVFLVAVFVNLFCLMIFLLYASSDPLFKPKVFQLDSSASLFNDGDQYGNEGDSDADSGESDELLPSRRKSKLGHQF